MALTHEFVSLVADDPAATAAGAITPSEWNANHVVDADGITMATRVDTPATPAAGKMVMFGKTVGGGALPAFIGPSGMSSALQPFLGRNKVVMYTPLGNATATTQFGVAVAVSGTATARNVATTNLLTATRRHAYVSAATANAKASVAGAAQFFLGASAGMGGFRLLARFGISDAALAVGANMFVGFSGSSTIANGSAIASALNIVGVGAESTDTNMQIFYNDGSGVASKIDLGANFPANTTSTDLYELALFAPSGSAASISYQVTRLNTGDIAADTLATDIPAANQLILPVFARNNLATGLAVGIDIALLYIETDN